MPIIIYIIAVLVIALMAKGSGRSFLLWAIGSVILTPVVTFFALMFFVKGK